MFLCVGELSSQKPVDISEHGESCLLQCVCRSTSKPEEANRLFQREERAAEPELEGKNKEEQPRYANTESLH